MGNKFSYSNRNGEIAVIGELTKIGFYCQWLGLFRPHEYDILAIKNNKKYRIEVKHTYSIRRHSCGRDSAGSNKIFKEGIDFMILVFLYPYAYIQIRKVLIFPCFGSKKNLNLSMYRNEHYKDFSVLND
jgi:hypothetical protein